MKKNLFIIIAFAAVVVIGAAAFLLLKDKDVIPNAKSIEKQLVRVKTITANGSELTSATTYVGKVSASKEVVVKSPFPGEVTQININKGEVVTAKQTVMRIYSESVNSSLKIAKASLEQAQDGYDRLMKIKDNGSVPEVKIVEVKTQLDKARASVKAAKKAVRDCYVKAPFDGVVSEIYVEKGENASISAPLLKIIDTSRPNVTVNVPENEIANINVGDTATLEIPALKINDITVCVTEKSVDAQTVSHSYQITLTPIDNIENLMPGMIGKIVFDKNNGIRDIVIPASTVRTDRNGRYVWTVDEYNTVSKTYIATGGFSGKGIIVTSGLEKGAKVIIEGASKVSTGMTVEIVEQ